MTKRALSGVRILDLSRVFAGPWATQTLADLGAEVIKVERPKRGDDARNLGPPFLRDKDGAETRESAFYLSANRNKKCITLDIATPEGQEIVRRLAAISDVVIENYKVGTTARYGLDYESLKAINPKIIYCSVTAFGQKGPNRHRLGYDSLFQGMGGLMSITGTPDDMPGGGPVKVGLVFADIITGMYATTAILAALYHRDGNEGEGQYIDLSLFDSQVAALSHQGMYYLISGKNPGRIGTAAPSIVPSQMFRCQDGYIVLVIGNDEQFKRFCSVLGRSELAQDERFASNGRRVQNRTTLIPMLEAEFAGKPAKVWLAELEAAGLVAGPINEISDVFADPELAERNMLVEVPHPIAGTLNLIGSPMRMSETPLDEYRAPPLLGEHTQEILEGLLGLDGAEIESLRTAKVI